MIHSNPPDLRALYARELAALGYRPDAPQSDAVDALDTLRAQLLASQSEGRLDWLPRPWRRPRRAVRGVYLWGPVGRGKTWLMDLFYDSVRLRGKQRSHFHHFMRDVHHLLGQLRGRPDPLALVAGRVARGTRLLCLDELYVSDIADAMILGQLFGGLLERGTTLVITANTPPSELYRGGLQRSRFLPAIALLERELQVVSVDAGVDYRLRQLRQRPLYFDSRTPGSADQLRQLMKELDGAHSAGR
jgi:cell division protein ZapE